jgi:hypothetical protein
MWALLQLATSPSVDARVREHVRATIVLVLLAQLLAGGERGRPAAAFGIPASWSTPRRRRPPYRSSLTGRRPRG